MSADRKGEIPAGYSWKELSLIKARFLVPDPWYLTEIVFRENISYIITPQPFKLGRFFDVGLTLQFLKNFGSKMKVVPSEFARDYVTQEKPGRRLLEGSQIVAVEDGPLKTYRAIFYVESVAGINIQPRNMYVEFTGNDKTGNAYMVYFECLSNEWNGYSNVARIMMESRVLNKEI